MSVFVEWSENLELDIPSIDQQHRQLVNLINELHEAMASGKSNERLENIIRGLIDYTLTHFKTEENYFNECNYRESFSHKTEHTDFVKRVGEFQKDFADGKILLSMKIMDFLKDWLVNHIQGSDKKYAALFIKKGIR